eukprot:3270615-Prymnesium_polylepis.2
MNHALPQSPMRENDHWNGWSVRSAVFRERPKASMTTSVDLWACHALKAPEEARGLLFARQW